MISLDDYEAGPQPLSSSRIPIPARDREDVAEGIHLEWVRGVRSSLAVCWPPGRCLAPPSISHDWVSGWTSLSSRRR